MSGKDLVAGDSSDFLGMTLRLAEELVGVDGKLKVTFLEDSAQNVHCKIAWLDTDHAPRVNQIPSTCGKDARTF